MAGANKNAKTKKKKLTKGITKGCAHIQSSNNNTIVTITDENGNCYNDSSAGFKGELPELEPGEYFEFTSEAPLNVPNAVFYGSCKVLSEGQKKVKEIRIPTFSLSVSGKKNVPTLH